MTSKSDMGGKEDTMKCLVVDLGGTFTKYCIMDEEANISEKGQVPSPVAGVQAFVDTITELYRKFEGQAEGLAISMPGFLDSETGYAKTAGAFLDMIGQNVFELLRPNIPVPISLENDGKCAALAEVWKGGLSDCQDGVAVVIGTGLAGGIIKNRRLHRGKHFTAGEISYLMIQPGNYTMQNMMCMPAAMMGLTMQVAIAKGVDPSTLEAGALIKRAGEGLTKAAGGSGAAGDAAPEAPQVKIDGPQIFKWLEEGDPAVTAIYRRFIEHLALMVYNIQVIYDPERIVIGGGVSRQERLIPDIQAEVNKIKDMIKVVPTPEVELGACKFLSDANLVGAMYNYMIHFHPELAK